MDASGYSYGESKSVKGGKFLGLPLDQVPVEIDWYNPLCLV